MILSMQDDRGAVLIQMVVGMSGGQQGARPCVVGVCVFLEEGNENP